MSAPQPAEAAPYPALAVLVDYDGTIASIDLTDALVQANSSEQQWLALEAAYRSGPIGSRALLEEEAGLLPWDPARLQDLIRNAPHDQTFVAFARFAIGRGIPIEVVSDGLGFFVAPGIASLGLADVPVYSATVEFGSGPPVIRFPHGNPTCRLCGTCKRDRVLHHQAAGRHVVFIGDGHSDRYAISYADTVFAKDDLVQICKDLDVPFRPWDDFDGVRRWIAGAIDRHELSGPVSRPYVCGTEAGGGTGDSDGLGGGTGHEPTVSSQ